MNSRRLGQRKIGLVCSTSASELWPWDQLVAVVAPIVLAGTGAKAVEGGGANF